METGVVHHGDIQPTRSALTWVAVGALALLAIEVVALRPLDDDVERWMVAHRTPGATTFFRAATQFGSPTWMFVGGVALAVAAVFRSAPLAAALVAVTLIRPVLSRALKTLVDRDRPPLADRLAHTSDSSFPSGHTLGATMFWLAIPAVLLAWQHRRAAVAATGVGIAVVVGVAWSRMYLGVHWLTDVLGGALLGVLVLAPVYLTLTRAPSDP